MQTKKLIERFHSEIQVNYFSIRLQLFLSILIGNFFCSPSKFLVFDERYSEFRFYLYWFLSSIITFCVLYGQQLLNKYMDRRLSWQTGFKRRLIGQIVYGLFLPALLTTIAVLLVFFPLTSTGTEAIGQYLRDEFRFVFLFMFILNLLFLLIYITHFARFVKDQYVEVEIQRAGLTELLHEVEELQLKLEDQRMEDFSDAVMLAPCLRVKYGYEDNYVALNSIAFIKSSADDKKLFTLTSNKEYTHNYSLDTLMKVLDHDQYYLMYRRYIVNRSIIKGYQALENGVLTIELKPNFEQQEDIFVSRQDAADFKQWFDAE